MISHLLAAPGGVGSRSLRILLFAVPFGLALTLGAARGAFAQAPAAPQTTLRERVVQRFEILPLQNGVVLRPRTRSEVRAIEVTDGTIAIDGQRVTGAELRSRLNEDADLVLQISYLDEAGRRGLFDEAAPPAAAAASAPPAPGTVAPAPPPPPDPPRSRRERRRTDDRVRFGGAVEVAEGERIQGDVVAIGGRVSVDGEVTGDVVAIGGGLRLGPRAVVEGNAVSVGGRLERADGARVDGDVVEVGFGSWVDGWRRRPTFNAREMWRPFGSLFSLLSTLVRVGVLCLLAALVLLVGSDYVGRVTERAVAEPLKAGAIGLLAQLLFVPLLVVTIVLFVVTIVGIPLLVLIPFAILALAVFALVGFTAVASYVGRWLVARWGWTGYSPYATTAIGIVVIVSPLILARLVGLGGGPLALMSFGLAMVGFLAEYVAWTVGMGAVALLQFNRPQASTSTPAPVPA
jgi:hypothetical protein